MTSIQYDCLIKMVLIGDSDVGKTAFFESFLYNKQKTNNPTIGVDFGFRTLFVKDKVIKIQIWDTAGQERFRSITQSYYRGSDIVVILYDITNIKSLNNIEMWYNNIKLYNGQSNKPYTIILIGNKSDLENKRAVSYEMGKEIALKYGMKFMETSSYNSEDIHNIISESIETTLEIKTDIISSSDKAKELINLDSKELNIFTIPISVQNSVNNLKQRACCY